MNVGSAEVVEAVGAQVREREVSPRIAALERILAAHEAFFNVERNHIFAGRTFPGYAEFHSQASQYVLVKRAKLWEVSAHEYLFFLETPHLTHSFLADAVAFATSEGLQKVQLSADHMTSYISVVIIADQVDPEVFKEVRKTRFRKNFSLGFRGWADLRLAVVDLSAGLVITNAMGKELRATLEANAFELV